MIKIYSDNAMLLDVPHVFNILESRSLKFPYDFVNTKNFKRLMQGLISRQPQKLHLHVQYIYGLLAVKETSHKIIFTAVVDLFIALKNSGLDLKKRLLTLVEPKLSPQEFNYLKDHLNTGISNTSQLPEGYYSMLNASITGQVEFIKRQQVAEKAYASVYEEALSLLEYGDLEQAQVLLELALQEKPNDATIAEELVTICLHLNDQETLLAMSHWFMENNLDLPKCWPLL